MMFSWFILSNTAGDAISKHVSSKMQMVRREAIGLKEMENIISTTMVNTKSKLFFFYGENTNID